jgi:transcriptional regulator GlxA family with amidase domain
MSCRDGLLGRIWPNHDQIGDVEDLVRGHADAMRVLAYGLGSAASLRAHFKSQAGTSPTAYRQAFAGAARE